MLITIVKDNQVMLMGADKARRSRKNANGKMFNEGSSR